MKILQINSVFGIGSTGRIVTEIDKILKGKGHDSYIAYGRNFARNNDTAIRIGNNFDNYMHVVKTRFLDKHGLGSKKATRDFVNKIEQLDPDIIHLHNIHGYYINIGVLFEYLKKVNKPVVWTLHDCWAFTGHCAYFDYVQCDKWKMGCKKCPQKNAYPTSWFLDNSFDSYRIKKETFTGVQRLTLVTPSQWLADLVKHSFLKEYPVKVINNGINLNIFRPIDREKARAKLGISNDRFIILGVAARFTERKGYHYFLKLSKMIDEYSTIILVGVGKKQKESLPKNIIGFTRTENIEELVEFYSMADVFVNPTLEDNFPTVNIESLATGTPIVTFNTGGAPEVIKKECGFVVKKGDINELYNAILKVRDRTKKNYIDNCINASIKYDAKDKYNEYIRLYEELIVNG